MIEGFCIMNGFELFWKDFLNKIKEEKQLQEIIRKTGNEYCLYSKKKGKDGKRKKLGCYPTRAGAEKRERQVQYFKHMGEAEEIEGKDSDKVAKVVFYNDNEVLLLKRSPNLEKYPDEWDLPGGHIHENESILDGLKREIYEETGLKADNYEKLQFGDERYFYFKAKMPKNSQIILDPNEHWQHKMIKIDKINDYDLSDKFKNAIEEALSQDHK